MSEHIAERQSLPFVALQPWTATPAQVSRAGAEGGVSCRLGDGSCAAAHADTLSRSASGQTASLHGSLLRLQRDYGNQYVGQVLRQASGERDGGGSMDAIERAIDGARGAGHGMDHSTRSRMEGAFGADFSGVRIHTDARADDLSQSLAARAFTTGRDVFFRQGEYSPGTSAGRELLAHELTHVVQQNGNGLQRKMSVSQPGDAHEVEADQMARAVIAQEHAPAVQRQEDDDKPVAAKHELQRQPEAPKPQDEEEKKKLNRQHDALAQRQAEDKPDEAPAG